MGIIAAILGMGMFFVFLIILGYIFWLCMFIDALRRRDVLWIVLFIFCFFTGFLSGIIALIYYFVAYNR